MDLVNVRGVLSLPLSDGRLESCNICGPKYLLYFQLVTKVLEPLLELFLFLEILFAGRLDCIALGL